MEPGKEGGTWLAMSKRGRLAALLNLTGEKRSSQTSGKGRGFLVADFVSSEEPPVDYLNRLHVENQANQPYNPYNLVLVDLGKADVHFLNSAENSKGPGHICCEEILGFGNSAIERPFRKVEAGKEAFREIVQDATVAQQEVLIKDLLKFLKWKESHLPDPELQERAPDRYKELSSIFVDVEGVYGTRTHSVILVDGQNNVTFVEDTLMPDGSWKYQTFNFPLESSV